MKRSGPIELSQHADWSTWRDVKVPLDGPPSADWLVRAEAALRRGVGGFQSMEFEPGRATLALVVNEPRDDAEAMTAEIDSCLASAAPSAR
jgi:hypothetical protein